MRIIETAVLAASLWTAFQSVEVCAAPNEDRHAISGLRRTNPQGTRQVLGTHWQWAVKAGAQGSIVQRTGNGGRSWDDRTPRGFTDSAPDLNDGDVSPSSIGLSALNSQRCWVAFSEPLKSQNAIAVEQTVDGGRHWKLRAFVGGTYSIVLQFLDDRHGFLLALGEPAAGQMSKEFYSTNDGGMTWTAGGSPNLMRCNYYPKGMVFRTPQEGWITGTNHGEPAAPLIRTRDGGKTWRMQMVSLPTPYEDGGADISALRFYGKSQRRGAFTARLIGSEVVSRTVNYLTRDGGEHWHIVGRLGSRPR